MVVITGDILPRKISVLLEPIGTNITMTPNSTATGSREVESQSAHSQISLISLAVGWVNTSEFSLMYVFVFLPKSFGGDGEAFFPPIYNRGQSQD